MKKECNKVTLLCLNCNEPKLGVKALQYSMQKMIFKRVVFLAHEKPDNLTDDIEFIKIKKLTSTREVCEFALKEMHKYIDTDFCLTIHDDGFIINPHLWLDEFLEYDYIGAPWINGCVGNGGFTLISKLFFNICLKLMQEIPYHGENNDWHTCVTHRDYFISKGCKFAPVDIAVKFSLESMIPEYEYDLNKCFGFHGRGESHIHDNKGQQFKDKIKLLDTIQ